MPLPSFNSVLIAIASRANRRSAGNRIRGPQSALTDFLASHNISAQQISTDYQQRIQRAAQQADASAEQEDDKENEPDVDENGEDAADRKKRKRKEEKALMKIKQSKEFKRRKAEHDEDEDDDTLARSMMARAKPLPGQFDNCEICEKRFTVTPYSKSGPDGGLLCMTCSKQLVNEEKKAKTQAKKAAPKGRRRQTESDRMMGDVRPGAKSLLESCVRRVADVVLDIEEFGDMPQNLLDRLSQILSKRRVMTPRTLELFLQPEGDRIAIYDSAKLDQEDFIKIFERMPHLERINLRFAGQLKDMALRYMITVNKQVTHLQLGSTNLISNDCWMELFETLGHQLESLKISELNDSLDDTTLAAMALNCQNLQRLKLRQCSHLTGEGLACLVQLTKLEYLSLAVGQDADTPILTTLVDTLGPKLVTLSLEGFSEADDSVLHLIHSQCTSLQKLRFTGSNLCTDQAFAAIFTKWTNPPLTFVDMADNRDLDAAQPSGAQDAAIGFGSEALKALMKHSGSQLTQLNLQSCRHIAHQALIDVFDGKKQYPMLQNIDFSFVAAVDDVVMTGIFRSCPQLTKLVVFACFNARQVRVPTGIAVIGLPNAQDNIVIEGGAGEGA